MLRSTSILNPLGIALLNGKLSFEKSVLKADGWIPFYTKGPAAYVIKRFSELHKKVLIF